MRQKQSVVYGKYGVKINWICDAENGYALKGLLYAGRSSEERQIDLASTKVGQLVQPFVNSNRNVFMDRYFTSYSTVQHLFEHGHTATGTVFAHRRDVLACLRKAARRDPYSTLAVYEHSKKITMISYVPRKNSNVLLLTSCHAKLKVDNQQGFKRPNIINHYNLGKGAWMQKYNIFAIKKTNKYIMRCCTSSLSYKTTKSIKTLRTRTSKEGRNQRKTAAIHTLNGLKHISNSFHRSIKSAVSFYYFLLLQLSNILRIKLTRVSGDVEEVISQNRKQVHCSHTPHYAFDK
ncbi:hypothetical protein T02_1249 [Trichinella nativa]|uniref:PiggyBac transposable element-derived protein domain-containing protein n=1 Tax=Trichinella nativa TaxID=6335 RepID=A0A0V1KNP3_9BILA|nr:hypothetical protein T02_1249 [Trichinella nativa]